MKKLLLLLLVFSGVLTTAHAYTHPGIPLTIDDLDTVLANLNNEPWKSGYAALQADSRSSLSYTMQGPFTTVSRNPDANLGAWRNDMQAIYNLARMWYFSGNTAYAQKAHDILIAWATTQTTFGGVEASFDLGDYAYRYAGGADILRGTWPGWTAADTQTVQTYFTNVFWPNVALPGPVMTGSQGMEQLLAAVAIAVFNDDTTKFNQVLSAFLTDGDSGLRDTLANGQAGDTGRDQGHTSLYVMNVAQIGEIFWKQGVDVFSVYDNRILAVGDYYSRYNLPGSAPAFVALGAPFWGVFQSISGNPRSTTQSSQALNILHGAYAMRKGMSTPWINLYRNDQAESMDSFMFRKSSDTSTATAPTMPTLPATASLTTGLTNADLNGCVAAGSGKYSGGTWTLKSGYNNVDPWGTNGADTVHFTYKRVTGDFAMIAKVTSVSNVGSASAKAGIMVRDALGTASNRFWVAMTPAVNYERALLGYTSLPYGSNARAMAFPVSQIPYWVKMERVGSRLQSFTSIDGGNWSPAGTADFANMPGAMYVGLFGTSFVANTASTATFTNVRLTGGDGGAAVTVPPAPFSVLGSPGDRQVTLRWNEAFGATSYSVKRSLTSGSGYTTLATVSTTTYTDTTVTNGTTYYYVVTALNSAGESGNSLQDTVTPQSSMVNVAVGGTATASVNGSSGTEGAAKAFDLNVGSKWFSGSGAGSSGWLQYDFGAGITQVIKKYAISSANDTPGRDPKDWQFQASNDGSSWVTLDTRSGQSFTYRYQTQTYSANNTTAYRYYRLNITASNGNTDLQLGELALLTDQGRTLPNGTYRLVNRKSNKALDLNGGGTANGTAAVQWTYDAADSQAWTLTDQGNGQYQILGVASGKVLDVSGGSTADGATVQIWAWGGTNNQKWTVTPTGDGFYKLTAVHSGKVVDVNGGSTADGATIIQWPYSNGANQQWSISVRP